MPVSSILIVAFIVAMFATFAGALAYAQYQTRNIRRAPSEPAKAPPVEREWRQAA